ALKGYSQRQGLAKLEELGFRKVNIVKIPGDNDRIIKVLANGKPVRKMQKVPVNSLITVEVYEPIQTHLSDSIINDEYLRYVTDVEDEMPATEVYEEDDKLFDAEPTEIL
ncbi:MAG: hypothetical protein J1E95_00210, partial [Muribaculaceae bacterium]|nr:hypothetical protein [Muribaculaceae bacterium]